MKKRGGSIQEVSDRVAVVTGAASGIGAALVEALRQQGVIVIGADSRPKGDIAALDVTDSAAVRLLLQDVVATHGRLDYMFNNAGIVVGGDFEDTDDAAWERVVDVNLWGVVHGTRAAYEHMLRQGCGHIVNTASSAGLMPVAGSTAYAASKHGVVGLSTSLRAEAAAKGVRVSVVVPGVVDTGIFASATNVGGYDYERAIERVPFAKVSPDYAAARILEGVARNRQFITFPAYNRVLVGLNRMLPDLMSKVVNR